MEQNKFEETFLEILKKTATCLVDAYNNNCEGENKSFSDKTRIVFPKKQKTTRRISEQELRFEFIHQLIVGEDDYWYSVETPTKKNYSGFSKENNNPICNTDDRPDGGRSGAVDLTIHDQSGNRIALIEFKANSESPLEYWKDFVKMNHEDVEDNYFVQLFEAADNGTFTTIENKIFKGDPQNSDKTDLRLNSIKYYCIVLKKEAANHKSVGVYYFDGKHISLKFKIEES